MRKQAAHNRHDGPDKQRFADPNAAGSQGPRAAGNGPSRDFALAAGRRMSRASRPRPVRGTVRTGISWP